MEECEAFDLDVENKDDLQIQDTDEGKYNWCYCDIGVIVTRKHDSEDVLGEMDLLAKGLDIGVWG